MRHSILIILGVILLIFVTYVVSTAIAIPWVEKNIAFQPPPSQSRQRISANNDDARSTTFVPVPGTGYSVQTMVARPKSYTTNCVSNVTVLYSHGNAEDLSTQQQVIDFYTSKNVNILAWDYPGYGLSGGTPSEQAVQRSVLAVYDWYKNKHPEQKIVGHGFSLGGGAATYLAAHRPISGVILESTFVSMASVPTNGIKLTFVDRFDNAKWLAKVPKSVPVLVAHGKNDYVVSSHHSQRLYANLIKSRGSVRPTGTNAHLLLVDGANHFNVRVSPQFWPAAKKVIGNVDCL